MPVPQDSSNFFYDNFPKGFDWGSTSSACSIEGGWNLDGRSMSWWDSTARRNSQAIIDQSRPDDAADSYKRFKEDVNLLKEMNATCYKFSLSWSRIFPDGTSHKVNKAGVDYYDNLINSLLEAGIEPIIMLYHFDFPQELFEKHPYNWMDECVIKAFGSYAQFCFKKFGDRIKRWVIIHDPWKHSECGFGSGIHPPHTKGSPMKVFKNLLKAHTLAFRIYEKEFRAKQGGQIGISINSKCISSSERNCLKNEVAVPDYAACTELRPNFNPNASPDYGSFCWNEIKSTQFDFIDLINEDIHSEVSLTEIRSNSTKKRNSLPNLNNTGVVLNIIKTDLNNPKVLLCGKGYPLIGSEITSLVDLKRTQYFQFYANEILKAIVLDGCNVVGFLPGTLVDSWEWEHGFTLSYGLHQVRFEHPLKYRIQRLSAKYLTKLFKTHGFSKTWDHLEINESHQQVISVTN